MTTEGKRAIHAVLFVKNDLTEETKIEMEKFARELLRGDAEYKPGAVVKDGAARASGRGCWYQEVNLDGQDYEMISLNNDLELPPFHALFAFDETAVDGPGGRPVRCGVLRADLDQLSVNAPTLVGAGDEAKIKVEKIRLSDEAIRRYRAAFSGSAGVSPA